MEARVLKNYINGEWVASETEQALDVVNPATGEVLARCPLSTRRDVDRAAAAAREAFWGWRSTPPAARAGFFFRLKNLLEDAANDLARTISEEEGKTLDDSRGEVRRGIENVEVACGTPSLMMGTNLEDIAKDIDTDSVRQPIGPFAVIAPFNFPFMVPLWFLPHAVALGNTYIIKPSEQVPLSQVKLMEVMDKVGFPKGVINLVHGGKEAVDGLLENRDVRGISFVGSAPVAKYVYAKGAENGKRVQALGGAKNFMIVMPDAAIEKTVEAIVGSAFGAAGERCLAGSVVLAVGDVYESLRDALVERSRRIKVGRGTDPGVEMGPLVSRRHMERVVNYINMGVAEGARLLLDGRNCSVAGYPQGAFVAPTIFDDVKPHMCIAQEEVFGPVLSIIRVESLGQALDTMNASRFGNAAAIFTASGKAAREFKYRAQAGMLGINVGVPAPMAFFTFTGWKESFFGDLHGHGRDAIEFFTEKKVVISRWF